jgi:hypothetical protein
MIRLIDILLKILATPFIGIFSCFIFLQWIMLYLIPIFIITLILGMVAGDIYAFIKGEYGIAILLLIFIPSALIGNYETLKEYKFPKRKESPFELFKETYQIFQERWVSAYHFRNAYGTILLISLTLLLISSLLLTRELINGDYTIYSNIEYSAICNDGWKSQSVGQGTCSHHGGIDYYLTEERAVGFHKSIAKQYTIITVILLIISLISYIKIRKRKTLN